MSSELTPIVTEQGDVVGLANAAGEVIEGKMRVALHQQRRQKLFLFTDAGVVPFIRQDEHK